MKTETKEEKFIRIVDAIKVKCSKGTETVYFSYCIDCVECSKDEKREMFERILSLSDKELRWNGLMFSAERLDGSIIYYGYIQN